MSAALLFFFLFFMFAAPLQCTLAVWYSACTTMTNDGTGTVQPLVMKMQTGSNNNHIFQIFFVLACSTNDTKTENAENGVA